MIDLSTINGSSINVIATSRRVAIIETLRPTPPVKVVPKSHPRSWTQIKDTDVEDVEVKSSHIAVSVTFDGVRYTATQDQNDVVILVKSKVLEIVEESTFSVNISDFHIE